MRGRTLVVCRVSEQMLVTQQEDSVIVKLNQSSHSSSHRLMFSCFCTPSLAAQDYNYNFNNYFIKHFNNNNNSVDNNINNNFNIFNDNNPFGEQHSEQHRRDCRTAA